MIQRTISKRRRKKTLQIPKVSIVQRFHCMPLVPQPKTTLLVQGKGKTKTSYFNCKVVQVITVKRVSL